MTDKKIKVIFTAASVTFRFRADSLRLGGIYPEMEISVVDTKNGVHEFSIVKCVQGYGGEFIEAAIKEATRQIEYFWNVLAYLQDTVIKPSDEVYYRIRDGEKIKYEKKSGAIMFGATLVADVNATWFELNRAEFLKKFNMNLLKRYNFARAIEEPIGRFISLYSLLATLAGDKQEKIDALLESEDPTIEKSYGYKGSVETIYTRLRNELAHEREGVSIFQTHSEIKVHLLSFEKIIRSILNDQINKV